MSAQMSTHMFAHMPTHMSTRMHVFYTSHIYTHVCTRVHTHVCTHTGTYIHTQFFDDCGPGLDTHACLLHFAHLHACLYICPYTCPYTCLCAYIHAQFFDDCGPGLALTAPEASLSGEQMWPATADTVMTHAPINRYGPIWPWPI